MDETYNVLRARGITVGNDAWSIKSFSTNTTIMDLALVYTQDFRKLQKINVRRTFKKLLFSFELTGFSGRHHTEAHVIKNAVSQIQWDFRFQDVSYPSNGAWNVWGYFTRWLSVRNISYTNDIDLYKHAT